MTIIELRDNLRKTPKPDVMGKNIVINDGNYIVELVKRQMMRGVRGGVRKEVAKLGVYAPRGGWFYGGDPYQDPGAYAIMKHKMNPEPGISVVDLKLTGAFYNAFYFDSGTMEVYSRDSKTADLEERYGKYIFKLTPDSITEYGSRFAWQFYDTFWSYLLGNHS